VAVLTGVNLLNYVDRWAPSAVKDLFKADLGLTDTQTGLPFSAFVVVYMLASPVFGALADRFPRRWLIALGVALWSLATGASALAVGFWTFLLARALVGVGEAAYATLAPALISDLYPPARRNRALTVFMVAIPVGAALGFVLGGVLGAAHGWRTTFMVVGFPGLLAAALVLLVKDPGRGTFDADAAEPPLPWAQAVRVLARNRTYVLAVAGYTAVNFAAGALGDWFPTLLHRLHGMGIDEAGAIMGPAVVLGGLGGTVLGGVLGDRLRGVTRHPYMAVSGLAMVVATALACVGILATGKVAIALLITLTQLFMWFYNGPINAVIVNCVPSGLRARAVALSILSIHVLGDAISPPLVGLLMDVTGSPYLAISVVPVAMLLGAGTWLWAWRTLPVPAPQDAG
jgi:predicted MFS family arabinose efflux permease